MAGLSLLSMGAMAATAASGAVGAASTLAGGNYAQAAGRLQAQQLRENANQALASGQRRMFDTQLQTDLVLSRNRANAAASGVAADAGSPLENTGKIAQRGEYHAMMDLFNGESAATGLRNEADAAEWEGNVRKDQSRLAAIGTLAGSVGSLAQQYGQAEFQSYLRQRGGLGYRY